MNVCQFLNLYKTAYRYHLSEFGLLINFEKSIFYSTQNLKWLGILWDSKSFSISVPTRRIDDTVGLLQKLVKSFPRETARE